MVPLRLRCKPPGSRLRQSVYCTIMDELLSHPHGLVHFRPPPPQCFWPHHLRHREI